MERKLMENRLATLVLLFSSILVGCTPLGEDVVRRAEDGSQQDSLLLVTSTAGVVESDPVHRLDPASVSVIGGYGPTIRLYAARYGFDWRLILAIMKQESRFSTNARSRKGAAGLMQIMPLTMDEVSRVLEIGNMDYPRNNIRGGIFYLRKLYDLFEGAEEGDRLKLALAAYNAGVGRIYDAQEVAAYFHDDPSRWQAIRDALPLLSKRYYSLHRSVWGQERPRSGWFGSSKQTVGYVENIMGYYDDYRLILN
jgi:membrane-bound lytic murein transglycosylase MltF